MHTLDVIAGEALGRRQDVCVDVAQSLAWSVDAPAVHDRMSFGQTLHSANAGGTVRVVVHEEVPTPSNEKD